MTARAFVREDFARAGIAIMVRPDEGKLMRFAEPTVSTVDPAVEAPRDAYMFLPDDIGRALFEALSRHYGGAGDMSTLRGDYVAERRRVDVFIAHMTRQAAP